MKIRWKIASVVVSSMALFTGVAQANNGICAESVNNYTVRNGPSLSNRISNSQGFLNKLAVSSGGYSWTVRNNYTDSSVWDRDFVDPERTGSTANADDTNNFDRSDCAISFFSGHGVCSGCSAQTACTSTSQCTSPAGGESLPGTCRGARNGAVVTGAQQGTCCYMSDRYVVTSGSNDVYNGLADYSNTFIKWGESSAGGSWAGAGTNGGTNLAVLDVSCGVLSPFWVQQLRPAFAGLQYVATILPVSGDTADVADRGSAFGNRWQINSAEPIANAWTYTLADLPANDGGACVNAASTVVGGGQGLNGCGCNFIISFDNDARAYYKMKYGNWQTIQSDANDAVTDSNYYWFAVCNYDTATYPWEK